MLGIDAGSLVDYLNGCLLEHLVYSLAQDKEWLDQIRKKPEALALFRERVQSRTQFTWDTENLSVLFDRVKQATEKHVRKAVTYEELLRLLINAPLARAKSAIIPGTVAPGWVISAKIARRCRRRSRPPVRPSR